jgi:transcriptional regulator with PAS, ATPase and Fis domain
VQFRADLYYRLNVLGVHLPALRERGDLAWLADQLLERIAMREGLPGRRVPPSVRAQWLAFDWPGNVRQLEAALLRFLLSGETGLPEPRAAKRPQSVAGRHGTPPTTTLQAHIDRERDACIRKTLAETAGDKDETARRLGISRATLYRELRRSPALS